MLLSLAGNHKTSKRQVAFQRLLKESGEARASHSINSLDGSYIDRNAVNKVKGPATVAENDAQNVKQLIVSDLNEKCNEYFRELFQNVDIDNWDLIDPLITVYNSRVRSLLVGIQTDYGFRLHCHDMEYDDVAVWTDLLQVSVVRSSTPLAPQANKNANSNQNFIPTPTLIIVI